MSEPIQIHSKGGTSATAGTLRVVLLYAGFSGLWILLSDRLVEALIHDPAAMTLVSILKGWLFVAVTAIMLFVMVRRLVGKVASREARLRTLMQAIPDLVWLKDPNGVYLSCNKAFEATFGAREADIVGRTDHDFVPRQEADCFQQNDREVLERRETRQQLEWVTPAGQNQQRLFETIKTPMEDHHGNLIGVLGIGRDVTEHHRLVAEQGRLEAQLQQAHKMELVGRFAGSVAHDYNNMLGVILANADLALYHLPQVHPERKFLEEIQRAARHSANLTHQLLAFARRQPVEPCLLDLNTSVAGMKGVLGRLVGPEVQLVWTAAPTLWEIRMDPTQLDQVLTNLVVNARDAITGSGRIEVATANRTLEAADCAVLVEARPGDHVCLSVSDNGCGMARELTEQIFEPFFTTKPAGRGTGLGLATVHGIVKQNHGVIQVDSEPGKGTTFRIYLPRATSAA